MLNGWINAETLEKMVYLYVLSSRAVICPVEEKLMQINGNVVADQQRNFPGQKSEKRY